MTTIAANTTEMAGDLQGTIGGGVIIKLHTKVFKFQPHELHYTHGQFIVGFSGETGQIMDCVDYFNNPDLWKRPPSPKSMHAVVLTEKKHLYSFVHPAKWTRLKQNYFAAGSGQQVALGALAVGASPKDAVLAATKVDPFTGQGVTVVSFK